MIRRSFRLGLVVGLVAGVAAAAAKLFGGRDVVPVPDPAPSPRPAPSPGPAPVPRPIPAPPEPIPAPPAPEPAPEPGPQPEPEPVPAPLAAAVATANTADLSAPPLAAPAAAKAPRAPRAPARKKLPVKAWVEPVGNVCPTSHPVKAKLSSKIFHLPGMLNYERTKPDRCYLDVGEAESDGLRAAMR